MFLFLPNRGVHVFKFDLKLIWLASMNNVQGTSVLELVLGGMLIMLILSLGVILFFITYQKRLLKQQTEHQQKEAGYQQQLLRANIRSQEKERNRIGKNLHDEVGAMLTTAKLYFRHLEQEASKEKFSELKEKVFDLLDGTIASVRRVSHDLRPVVLETLGLEEAVANIRDQLNASGEIEMKFTSKLNGEMDREYQLNWYRIIQELVNNTLRHAEASCIEISMIGRGDELRVVYKDNGIGISTSDQSKIGLGLSNIESRLSLMHGAMNFKEPKKGVAFELTSSGTNEIHDNG